MKRVKMGKRIGRAFAGTVLGIALVVGHTGRSVIYSVAEPEVATEENVQEEPLTDEAVTNETVTDETVTDGTATDQSVLQLKSPSCILMEATTGTVLYEKNADEARKPASVTKVMTLLLIFEAMKAGDYQMSDIVTVSEHAASMGGSQCFFEAGEQQTVEDMIKCIIIASGNDAAVAMAEFTAGSEEAFVQRMNDRAKELGMEHTHFVNACGLDADGHETSARDIAIMSRQLIDEHPEILNYSGIWMDSIIHKTARGESRFDLANTNKFLNMYTGATGLKTGYTATAKYCMSATANRNGITLIAVIMGAETKDIRNKEVCKLFDYGYASCNLYKDENVLDTRSVSIENGISDELAIESTSDFSSVLLRGEKADDVKKTPIQEETLTAPINKGDVIGKMEYSINGRVLGSVEIVAAENIKKMTFGYSFKKVLYLAFRS